MASSGRHSEVPSRRATAAAHAQPAAPKTQCCRQMTTENQPSRTSRTRPRHSEATLEEFRCCDYELFTPNPADMQPALQRGSGIVTFG